MIKLSKKQIIIRSCVGFLVFSFLWVSLAFVFDAVAKTPMQATNAAQSCSTDAGRLLALINSERSVKGSPQLVIDPNVVASAQAKLSDMTTNHYFGHYKLDGTNEQSFFYENGVKAAWSADIGMNSMSPDQQWESFKNSSSHYASLTDAKYSRVGIATQCTKVHIDHVTGPDDNSKVLNTDANSFTVVYLAAPEPTPTPQVETRYVPTQTYVPTYTPHVQHTYCTTSELTGSISCSTY